MVWAKLDDEILDNKKIARAGVLGFALHVAAVTWCCRNLTDGFIPDARVPCLLDFEQLIGEYLAAADNAPSAFVDAFIDGARELGNPVAKNVASQLVTIGLWRRDDGAGGYWIHDFLDYNPSKKEVLSKRKGDNNRQKRRRSSRVESRRDSHRDSAPDHTVNPSLPDPDPDPEDLNLKHGGLSSDLKGDRSPPAVLGVEIVRTLVPIREAGMRLGTPAPDELRPEEFERLEGECMTAGWPDPRKAWPECRDYYRARGALMADWSVALRSWLRKANRYSKTIPGASSRDGVASAEEARELKARRLREVSKKFVAELDARQGLRVVEGGKP